MIEHYDYYLRRRKFHVITDHSALKAMKTKESFGRIKLERMRKRLQQYNFEIEYRPGKELVNADTISRIHSKTEDYLDKEKANSKTFKLADGKIYYKEPNQQALYEVPEIISRNELIDAVHKNETCHRGRDAILNELKKKYYWMNMTQSITNYLENCKECLKNDQNNLGGENLIYTSAPREIFGCDLMFINQQTPVLVFVDYFIRVTRAELIRSKKPIEIKRS